jgi:hypothetical protein
MGCQAEQIFLPKRVKPECDTEQYKVFIADFPLVFAVVIKT